MAEDILFDEHGCNAQDARTYYFSFVPNNASDPTAFSGYGITAVKYVATGIFKVVFNDSNWIALLDATCTVQAAAGGTGDGFVAQVDTTNTSLANGTVAFALLNTAQARATYTGDANSRVYGKVVVSKGYNDSGGP